MLGGIRTRLLGLVIATVLPFALLVGVGLRTQYKYNLGQTLNNALIEAKRVADRADDEMGNLQFLLSGLSYAVSTDSANKAKNDAMFRDLRSALPGYVGSILLSTLDGENIGTSAEQPDEVRVFIGDRDFFQTIRDGQRMAIGMPVRGRVSGNWVSAVARGVYDENEKLVALLAVGIQVQRFLSILGVSSLPQGTVVQITKLDGTVIARSVNGEAWIGRDVRDDPMIQRHTAMSSISETVVWPDGIERITGSSTMRRAGWLVSVGLPMEAAIENVVLRLVVGSTISLAVLLMALGLGWALASRITQPLRQLSSDASILAGGNLGHRSAVRSEDELGALAKTFNTMAASLEGRERELIDAREAAASEAAKRTRSEEMERQAKETLSAVIDSSPVAIVCSDNNRNLVIWSRAAERIFGYKADEVLGLPTKIVPASDIEMARDIFGRTLGGETIRDLDVKRQHKDGTLIDVRLSSCPMYNPDGTPWGIALAYDDMRDRKRAEEQLSRLAHYDPLTGLPNRLALRKELSDLLAAGGHSIAIAMFDLDGFKDVNDTAGHSVGDRLLVQVAQRLTKVLGDRGKVCRLGGDEFVAVLPDCGEPGTAAEIVNVVLSEFTTPFEVDEHVFPIGGSAGIAIAPQDGSNAEELIANADLALYKAKTDGGRTSRFFAPTLRAQAQIRHGLQIELRRAFAKQEFELYFQPQVRLADDAVVGAEALLRWQHPGQGILSPSAFIDTLSRSSIALDLGRWVVQEACEQTVNWRNAGLELGRISVNLFPGQCTDVLPADIEAVLAKTGLPASVLELEITETVALNHDDAIAPLQELRQRGVKLAFDDFGTGFASLSYLTRYPVSRIKIDRSFVDGISDDSQNAAIVRSLIAMARSLGLSIIAEGVESQEQAAFLLKARCDEGQGYLYSRPLPANEFEAYLRSRRIASPASGPADHRRYRGPIDLGRVHHASRHRVSRS